MAQINVELDFDKLLASILRLPRTYKIRIWQALDAELNRDEINREFAMALEENWNANADADEEQVNADIETAFSSVRTATLIKSLNSIFSG